MAISMLKIRRPLGRLIFNMGIAIPGKTVFLIETAPWSRAAHDPSLLQWPAVIDFSLAGAVYRAGQVAWTAVGIGTNTSTEKFRYVVIFPKITVKYTQ